jgi:AhpD family alkylhydroperoxidase
MKSRIDIARVSPKALQPLFAVQAFLATSGLEHKLLALVKIRASQINGCANCLDMHTKDARADGETEQRLYLLDAWRESPFYSERERAALAWTEALTCIADGHVPDDVYEQASSQFTEQELAALSLAVVGINSWNRLSIAFRVEAGWYQPGQQRVPRSA